jgi:hypothetical protein
MVRSAKHGEYRFLLEGIVLERCLSFVMSHATRQVDYGPRFHGHWVCGRILEKFPRGRSYVDGLEFFFFVF